jgi:hypothetical protein
MKLVRAKILGPDFREDEPERAAIGEKYGPDKDRLTKWLNEFAPRKRIINKESMLSILPSSCEKAVLSNRRAAGSNRKVKRVDRNVTHAVLHVVSSWFVPRTCRQLSSGADNLSLTREKELCEWKSVCGNLSIFRHFGSKPIHSFNENPSNFLGG